MATKFSHILRFIFFNREMRNKCLRMMASVSVCRLLFSHYQFFFGWLHKNIEMHMLFFQYTIVKIFKVMMFQQPSKVKELNNLEIFFLWRARRLLLAIKFYQKPSKLFFANFSFSPSCAYFLFYNLSFTKQKKKKFFQRLTLRLIFFSYTKVALPHLISNRK